MTPESLTLEPAIHLLKLFQALPYLKTISYNV